MAAQTAGSRRKDKISALPEVTKCFGYPFLYSSGPPIFICWFCCLQVLALQLLVDQASGRPLLDPVSFAHLEAAGGGIGRLARTFTKQWIAILDEHRWLLGRASLVPPQLDFWPSSSLVQDAPSTSNSIKAAAEESSSAMAQDASSRVDDWSPCTKHDARALKARALKLAQWAQGSEKACGHVLLVGGNIDRSQTFAEEPVDDASVVNVTFHFHAQGVLICIASMLLLKAHSCMNELGIHKITALTLPVSST